MKILLGADHAGFEMKNKIREYFKDNAFDVEDFGAKSPNEDDNYPEILTPLAFKIAENPKDCKGIVFGKSGQGEAAVCNRFPGVRAIVYYGGNLDIIKLGREHNDSNVLSLGAGFLTLEEAIKAVDLWLTTPFSGEDRHVRRNEMMDEIH